MISRGSAIFVGLALITGVMLTAWVLAHLPWPRALPWQDISGLARYVIFLTACTVLVFIVSAGSKKKPLFAGFAIAIGLALLSGTLWPLLVTLWFAVASALLGKSALARIRTKVEHDNWPISILIGAGIYGTAIGLLAHFSVNYPGVYGIALALPIVLNRRLVAEKTKNLWVWMVQKSPAELGVNMIDVAIVVVALVYFIVALMPEVGHDALAMHLFVPAHLAQRHQWSFDASTYVWAVMPMLGDWIFSIGYLLAGETAARLINAGFIFILGWLVRELVWWASGSVIGARWAVLVFLSTPLTFMEGSSLFIESVWASFVVAGTLTVLRTSSTLDNPGFDLPVAGLLLGFAAAAKAVTLTILPVLLLVLVWRYRSWYKTASLTLLALGLGLFLAIGSIPYITAWQLTGNPVFPFFNALFQSPYYPFINFDSASIFGKGLTWDILYRATFESGKYLEAKSGASGFQWLLLFLPSLVMLIATKQRKGGALVLIGVLMIALIFQSVSYFRYAFPAWAILAAAMGVALSAAFSDRKLIKYCWYGVSAATIALNLLFLNAGAQYRDFALGSIVSESSREHYLQGRLPIRNVVGSVNRLNIGRAPVAVFSQPLTAGLAANALYPNWYNHVFQGEIASMRTEQDAADVLLKRHVDFVILDSNWSGIGGKRVPETLALIEKATEKLVDYGSISVRRIRDDYRYKTELLSNPDFMSIQGWTLAPGATYDAEMRIILASVVSPATQVVAVSPGQRYLNVVVARCAKEAALGRVQVNWLDAGGRSVGADIKTFECSSTWAEHSMEAIAPLNAANAKVYVNGNSSVLLEFKGNSLRQ